MDNNPYMVADPAHPPDPGDLCPDCPYGYLEDDGRVETLFGDIRHFTCSYCPNELAVPIH